MSPNASSATTTSSAPAVPAQPASFFQGALGKVAVYDYALSAAQLRGHVRAMGL